MPKNIKSDKSGNLAALISFCIDSEKFPSNYSRNKFYRGLYGWKQVIKKNGREYAYQRGGILDKIPHIKVDKSIYIVPMEKVQEIENYMDQWGSKVDYKIFKVLLESDRFKKIQTQKGESENEWIDVPVKG